MKRYANRMEPGSVYSRQKGTGFDRIADCAVDGRDLAVYGGDHGDLHLHGFKDDDCLALLDFLADLHFDLEDLACRTGLDQVGAGRAAGGRGSRGAGDSGGGRFLQKKSKSGNP